jgi:hypothetical protein
MYVLHTFNVNTVGTRQWLIAVLVTVICQCTHFRVFINTLSLLKFQCRKQQKAVCTVDKRLQWRCVAFSNYKLMYIRIINLFNANTVSLSPSARGRFYGRLAASVSVCVALDAASDDAGVAAAFASLSSAIA